MCCPKVSVVVPVYNVSEYIVRCWDSIKNQSYKNLEVLFVDDCGTDDSVTKLETCVEGTLDFDIKILHHQRNRGLSAARNTGLKAATGDYIYFLDSDDEITPDCIEALANAIDLDFPCDFVIGGYSVDGDIRECPPLNLPTGTYCGNHEILRLYAEGEWYMMAWNKLCRKEFLMTNSLFFEEGLVHEDVLWSFKLACLAESMTVVNEPTYIYTIRANSIMTAAKVDKDARVYVQIYRRMVEFVNDNPCLQKSKYVYHIIEGRKSTLLFSLLNKERTDLYKDLYSIIADMCYVNVFRAFRSRIIGVKHLIRDIHYIFPACLGRMYKSAFYWIAYKLCGLRLEGTLW